MELYVYDRELNKVEIVENFISFKWVRKYYKSGQFELYCPLTTENISLLQKENIIYKKGDKEAGYIEYRKLEDVENKEILVVKGHFLTGYLNRRIIWGIKNLNDTVENAMRCIVSENCIDVVNKDRKIPNLILSNINNFSEIVVKQVSYNEVLEELENLSNTSNIGYRIEFDRYNKKLLFTTYKGINRSKQQNFNSRAIFSKEFENILEQQYMDDIVDFKNTTLIAGVGEGAYRKVIDIGKSQGLDRFELFTDARDLNDTKQVGKDNEQKEIPIPLDEYMKMLKQRGTEKLAEKREVQTFDSKVNLISNLRYKIDFDLGDIVTCISRKWRINIDVRITEIEEIYENNTININITFGNSIPTIIDKIKQR